MTNLFIFSNDLRLQDNEALYEASLNADALEAVFLFSPNKWKLHNESSLKIKFQLNNLEILKEQLERLNINLKILKAENIEKEAELIANEAKKINAKKVFINSEYGVNEQKRDSKLKKMLGDNKIDLEIYDS